MSCVKHFEKEWAYLQKSMDKLDFDILMDFAEPIKQIAQIFDDQDHSGFSARFFAPMIANIIKHILLYKPTVAIKEGEEEFYHQQSRRLPGLFLHEKIGKAYYLDAIVWHDLKNNNYFTGTVNNIPSAQFIKYPFYPKTYCVSVVESENGYTIIDVSELFKAWIETYELTLLDSNDEYRIGQISEVILEPC